MTRPTGFRFLIDHSCWACESTRARNQCCSASGSLPRSSLLTKKRRYIDHSRNETEQTLREIPIVDWLDLETDKEKFLADLRYALSECGFLVLTSAPGLGDEFQQCAFNEVRGFFDAPMDLKKTAH